MAPAPRVPWAAPRGTRPITVVAKPQKGGEFPQLGHSQITLSKLEQEATGLPECLGIYYGPFDKIGDPKLEKPMKKGAVSIYLGDVQRPEDLASLKEFVLGTPIHMTFDPQGNESDNCSMWVVNALASAGIALKGADAIKRPSQLIDASLQYRQWLEKEGKLAGQPPVDLANYGPDVRAPAAAAVNDFPTEY